MPDRGVFMIAFGEKAQVEMNLARRDLRFPVHAMTENLTGLDNTRASRAIKTTLLDHSPFRDTLYLDADTRAQGPIETGFAMLEQGFDMALSFSSRQNGDAFWHISDDENRMTLQTLGYEPIQWQCGVLFVRRCEQTKAFFRAWHNEWKIYAENDQAAFVRALHKNPLKLWVLGRPWNGGSVIQHRFGACR